MFIYKIFNFLKVEVVNIIVLFLVFFLIRLELFLSNIFFLDVIGCVLYLDGFLQVQFLHRLFYLFHNNFLLRYI